MNPPTPIVGTLITSLVFALAGAWLAEHGAAKGVWFTLLAIGVSGLLRVGIMYLRGRAGVER